MKLFTIIAFFTIFNCSGSQNKFEKYDKFVWNGMLEYKDSHYKESLDYFESAFKVIPDENSSDYFYAAAAALHLNNYEKAKYLIIQSIKMTNASEGYFDNFNEFNEFRNNKIFKDIKSNYDKYQESFFDNLEHPEIYREVETLITNDQTVRNNGASNEERRIVDSLNVLRLIEITKKYGWHSKGFTILWHQRGNHEKDDFVWSFFRPFINEGIENGEIRKDYWSNFIDEKSVRDSKQQVYGLYSGQYELYPLIDVKNVDKRRATVGMPPLWYLNKVYNTPLPEGYKKPEKMTLFK